MNKFCIIHAHENYLTLIFKEPADETEEGNDAEKDAAEETAEDPPAEPAEEEDKPLESEEADAELIGGGEDGEK